MMPVSRIFFRSPCRTLSAEERVDWLRLIRSENVGPITFFRLLERCGSAAAALAALPDLARRGGRDRPLRLGGKAEARQELAACAALGVRLLAACEPDYPEALAAIEDPPPLLAVRGHPHLLSRPLVAMVGARNASLNGRRLAETLARDLGDAGYGVVSGLARGIDAAAHQGSLHSGTVAVVAGGIDVVYPEENRELFESIGIQGAVVAEMPVGTIPQARHFPRRNRIISGLALATVVVEASPKSGSLITARLALEQGRDVMAVPGSPLDPRAKGPNSLLRDGAILVESGQDVLNALAGQTRRPLREPPENPPSPPVSSPPTEAQLEAARAIVLESLSPTPVQVDELIRGCQLSAAVVLTILLEMELAGKIQRHPGHQVSLL